MSRWSRRYLVRCACGQLHFSIKEGQLYYFDKIGFEGLETIKPKEAKAFFVETARCCC
jgi:hypothetical protein